MATEGSTFTIPDPPNGGSPEPPPTAEDVERQLGAERQLEASTGEAGSLKARLHARRAELQQATTEDFEVPGFEDTLVARYHLIPWKEHRKIAARHEREKDHATRELYIAADTLVTCCDDLLERRENGEHQSLGFRWSPRAASELFGLSGIEAGETARQALLAIFPRDTLLMTHYGELMEWQQGKDGPGAELAVDEQLAGESAAGSTGV